jgi:hypothetical protein
VRFRSRVDWWLAVLLVALPAIGLVAAIALQLSGDGGAFVGWLSLLGIVLLYVGVVWPVAYELGADDLVIRFGLVRSRMPYGEIRGVAPTRSVLAAPALSMDRLAIDVGGRTGAVISPDDRDGFLDALASRAPHLAREGDRLVARH